MTRAELMTEWMTVGLTNKTTGGRFDLFATLRDGTRLMEAVGCRTVLVGGIALFAYDDDPPITSDVDFGTEGSLQALLDACKDPARLATFGFALLGIPRRRKDKSGKLHEKPTHAILMPDMVQIFHVPDLTPLHVSYFDTRLDSATETIEGVTLAVATVETLIRTKAIAAASWRRKPAKRAKDSAAIISLLELNPDLTLAEFADLPADALEVVRHALSVRGSDEEGWTEIPPDGT